MIDLKNFKVNMTQTEFNEFEALYVLVNYAAYATARVGDATQFPELHKRLYTVDKIKKTNEFNVLWAVYNPENPYDLIEIAPSKIKKWFVVSKNTDEDGDYVFVSNINKINDFVYSDSLKYVNSPKCMAHAFDTEEEANQWKTPQMQVVNSEEAYEN